MTEQMPDWVFYDGMRFSLEWDSSGKLPLLSELGVHPLNISTATRRGYEADYEFANNRLFLTRLVVGDIQFLDNFHPIGDVEPAVEYNYLIDGKPTKDIGDVVYYLKYPMSVDGTIAIDCWGIDDRHLSPREQFKIKAESKTLKLKLIAGYVQDVIDVTSEANRIKDEMEKIRQKWRNDAAEGKIPLSDAFFEKNNELRDLQQEYQTLLQADS